MDMRRPFKPYPIGSPVDTGALKNCVLAVPTKLKLDITVFIAGSVLLLWVSGPEDGRLAKPRRSDQRSSLFYIP